MLIRLFKRIVIAIPTLLILTFFLFLLIKAIPGDPAQMLLGDRGSAEALNKLREQMGLNKPLIVQYLNYITKIILEGDFGLSMVNDEPISQILAEKFPATFELGAAAMLLATLIGIPAGLIAARFLASFVDIATMTTAIVGVSMPVFWLGLIFMWLFGVHFGWLPLSGRMGIEFEYEPYSGFLLFDSLFIHHDFELFLSGLKHIILPALTLATIPMAFLARMTRNTMLEVIRSDYIRTARAKGLSTASIYLKHALKNASLPITTMFGLQFGTLMGGAAITETIFAWPGIGRWILDSVSARDMTALEGGVIIAATAIVAINTLVDITYHLLDPRVAHE